MVGKEEQRDRRQSTESDGGPATVKRSGNLWKILLGVLSICILAYGWFLSENTHGDIGFLAGYYLTVSSITWAVFNFSFAREKGSKGALICFLVIHVSFMLSGYISSERHKRESREAVTRVGNQYGEIAEQLLPADGSPRQERNGMVTAGQSQGVLELPAAIQKPLYRRVHLEYGIHLEIPSHWRSLPEDARLNLGASAHGMLDDAGINGGLDGKRRLLAVNSRPEPNGAMIRVSVESPSDIAETDLAGVIGADLKRVEAGLAGMFARLEKSGGPKILEMQRARVGEFNDRRALIVSYVRAGTYGQSPWQVTQYKIPVANALIELTLSYRQSDGAVWRPILGRVKRSMDLRGVSFSGSGSVRSSQALQERDSALSVVIAFQEIADRYARASKEMTAAAAEFIKEDQKSDSSVRHLERVKSTLIRCEAAFRNHEEIRQEGHDYLLLNEGSFDRGFLEDSLFGFGDESVVQYNRAFFRFSSEYRETIDYLILNYERIMSSSEPEASVYYAKWRNSSALRQEHDEAYLRKIAALKSRHGEEELKAAMEALEH